MKITIYDDKDEVLKSITLTDIQFKALYLNSNGQPEQEFIHKLERILDFEVEQAKQLIAKRRVQELDAMEMDSIISEIEAEKVVEEEAIEPN